MIKLLTFDNLFPPSRVYTTGRQKEEDGKTFVCNKRDRAITYVFSRDTHLTLTFLAPVVQKVDSAIQWINIYPVDSAIGCPNTYPQDSDLSSGSRYPAFEQLGPGRQKEEDGKTFVCDKRDRAITYVFSRDTHLTLI